ncbi:MAG: hypothetical protein R3277_08565 [Brumimicrobium sp.]|nr:hypothetical protein [Brumimicrobium sp.]
MKRSFNLFTPLVCFIGLVLLTGNNIYSQGNNNGNANQNNNANANAIKWEMHGNQADTTHFIGTTNPTALKMRTHNVERMRITKDGKFGIGISNPLEKFELQGNLKLTGDIIFSSYSDLSDTTGKILFVDQYGRTTPRNRDQLKDLIYADAYSGLASVCDVEGVVFQNPVWNNGPNKIFSRCPQVYVGIGTDSPQKLLDVRGTTQTRILEVGREISSYSLISGYRTGLTNSSLLSLGQYNPQTQTEHLALELKSSGD